MSAAIPSVVPAEIVAGDTTTFTRDYADYPAGTWTAKFYFELGASQSNATASASGTTHSFSIAATATSGLKPGRYRWWVRVTSGIESHTIEDGWLDVKADPAGTGQRENRSTARQLLDAVEATLLGKATADQLEMSINGRSLKRIPLSEIKQFRTELREEVRTAEGGSTAAKGRDIKVRFVRG